MYTLDKREERLPTHSSIGTINSSFMTVNLSFLYTYFTYLYISYISTIIYKYESCFFFSYNVFCTVACL